MRPRETPAPAPTSTGGPFAGIAAGEGRAMADRVARENLDKKSKAAAEEQVKLSAAGKPSLLGVNPTPKIGGFFGRRRMKEGGAVKKMAKGGSVSSASKRADGCAIKGKTKGRMV
jgi:hypothetical protein